MPFGYLFWAPLTRNTDMQQAYVQYTSLRLEEMRLKRRDGEQWMCHPLLPDSSKARIRRYEQYKWQENRGVDAENLIQNLPKDLRRDIKRHLCLALLMRVSSCLLLFYSFNFIFFPFQNQHPVYHEFVVASRRKYRSTISFLFSDFTIFSSFFPFQILS